MRLALQITASVQSSRPPYCSGTLLHNKPIARTGSQASPRSHMLLLPLVFFAGDRVQWSGARGRRLCQALRKFGCHPDLELLLIVVLVSSVSSRVD